MRKVVTFFSLLLVFLLLYAYFNQPHETMSSLYQKIPEQVRQNSQLVAAYYYSQTGLDGFREYQFAFYNPKERKVRIYTFKIIKLLKFIPTMRDDIISCEAPFNYSILATSPEKLREFKNCDNCRELLYKGKIYRDKEIENIYPSIEEVIKGKENTTYVNLALTKDGEISTGKIVERVGDMGILRGPLGYGGLLHLPSAMSTPWKGVVIEFITESNGTIKVIAHYPGNITLSTIAEVKAPSNKTWRLDEVPLTDIMQKLKSEELASNIKGSLRFELSITREKGRIEAWTTWVNPGKGIEGIWRIYPQGKIKHTKFKRFSGYVCTWYGSNILEKLP